MSDAKTKPRTFFDLFIDGQATAQDVDDYVTAWHNSGDEEQRPLTEFLGMTEEGCNIWTMDRRTLPLIAAARRPGGASILTLITEYQRCLRAENNPINRSALHTLGYWLRARGIDPA